MKVNLVINDAYLPYIYTDYPEEHYFGGAGSGKSYFVSQKKVLQFLEQPGHNAILTRKVAATLRDSVFAQTVRVLNDMNITQIVKTLESQMRFEFPNGNQMICKGLDDPQKLKSITFKRGVLTDIISEEATENTQADEQQLDMRLRGRAPVKKQKILMYNPINRNHWIKKLYHDIPDPKRRLLVKTTHWDNLFLDEADHERIEQYKIKDNGFYNIYGLGEWGDLKNLVYNNWIVEEFKYTESDMPIRCGQDWGVNDPAVCLKVGFKDQDVFIFDEFYKSGITSNAELIELERPLIGTHPLICDNSEIKSIADFYSVGIKARACTKGKDSVVHGIKWLCGRKIHVHPKCVNTIKELQSYKWTENKNGEVLDYPVDLFNHAMDALRYSCEDWMTTGGKAQFGGSKFLGA